MGRGLALAYGLTAYLGFLGVFVALADFLTNAGFVRGIDHGPTAPLSMAIALDLALIALFGVSHSVLARPSIKRRWTRVVPPVVERSTYVLITNLVLAAIIWQWRALPATVWNVASSPARALIWALFGAGIAVVVYSSFLTDHFDLFGLRQVWLHARGRPHSPVPFRLRGAYRWVRHPMMSGILIMLWAAPTMSVGHLLFAAGMSIYVAIGTALEERDLARAFGDEYSRYRRRVNAFLPLRRWRD